MKLDELTAICDNIDLDEYIQFREKVKSNMNNKEWLGDFSKDTLIELLNNHAKIWIYYLNNNPVCSMMFIPADKKSPLKFELDLDSNEVAEYGPMFVHSDYIGNGLQYQMLEQLDKYCKKLGYIYAVSTVHPDNNYSINNLEKDGFKYQNTKEFKRGIRNIYLKEF